LLWVKQTKIAWLKSKAHSDDNFGNRKPKQAFAKIVIVRKQINMRQLKDLKIPKRSYNHSSTSIVEVE